MQSNTPTSGVRTWRRLSPDTTLPVDQRVTETTAPEAMADALAEADFVTIPKRSPDRPEGYTDAYARAFADALAERFGYHGGVRASTSGRSHVVEREAVASGGAIDLGLQPEPTPPAARPTAGPLARTAGGDGAIQRPVLHRVQAA